MQKDSVWWDPIIFVLKTRKVLPGGATIKQITVVIILHPSYKKSQKMIHCKLLKSIRLSRYYLNKLQWAQEGGGGGTFNNKIFVYILAACIFITLYHSFSIHFRTQTLWRRATPYATLVKLTTDTVARWYAQATNWLQRRWTTSVQSTTTVRICVRARTNLDLRPSLLTLGKWVHG